MWMPKPYMGHVNQGVVLKRMKTWQVGPIVSADCGRLRKILKSDASEKPALLRPRLARNSKKSFVGGGISKIYIDDWMIAPGPDS